MGYKYSISFDRCSNLYTRRINTDLLSLRAILTAIEDGTYNNHEIWHTGGVDYAVEKVKLNDELRTYEVVKTFISVMRNTNDYLDRLISIINFTQKNSTPGVE